MASWCALPNELLIDIVGLLPPVAVRALASTSRSSYALCLPAIFANVDLRSAESLCAFAVHVPRHYGPYITSLSVCTQRGSPFRAEGSSCTDALVDILSTATRLQSLSLSLAASLDPRKIIPAFALLPDVHTLSISNSGSEDLAPLSERLAVSLAASLPSLTHLKLSRISRSTFHVDPCDVPYNVPIVTNDFDIPPHPLLDTALALPSLLTLPSLRVLEIRDTWLGCDSKLELDIDPAAPRPCLEKLVLTGNMYTSPELDSDAYTAWIRACGPALQTLVLGTALASESDEIPPSPSSIEAPRQVPWGDTEDEELPRISHLHIDASLVRPEALQSTMAALSTCGITRTTVSYGDSTVFSQADSEAEGDEFMFMRECALDDLEEWRDAVEAFLRSPVSGEYKALRHIGVVFSADVKTEWGL
ncbi:hypothetical protein ID866_9446 [Astraeus odoratus]|nr:hypothetical protein ID866_9446 [Astraeus odoratus]